MAQSVTVGYGSFSLTVNGYENPFEVIREVTELCARISGQYPSFGSEPMQTEMTNTELAAPAAKPDNIQSLSLDTVKEEDNLFEEAAPKPMNVQPLKLEKPLPKYRRIDLSQIRAAAEPLEVAEMHGKAQAIRRFPKTTEH